MSRKIIAAVVALSALTLGGCSWNSAEGNEQVSEIISAAASAAVSQRAETESASTVTTSVTSETAEVLIAEFAPPYIDDGKPPVVMAAEELYDTYPVKIIYPEKQDVSDKVKIEVLQEDIFNSDGFLMVKFYAEYPVISGYDEAVCKSINDEIHEYIYGALEDEKKWVEWYEADDLSENAVYKEYGFFSERKINIDGTLYDGDGCDINGNIFTVYFAACGGFAGSIYQEYPAALLFDLRSGERIYFSDLVEDKDGISKALYCALWNFRFNYGGIPFGRLDADKYINIPNLKKLEFVSDGFGVDEDGNLLVVYENADGRITVVDGCVSFYLWRADYGDFAIGIERADIPVKEIVPYLNEKGKLLFDGYTSAETEPSKVIEYKGKRWFDTTEWIPEIFDRKNLTDYDREFILMFENARNVNYYLNNE